MDSGSLKPPQENRLQWSRTRDRIAFFAALLVVIISGMMFIAWLWFFDFWAWHQNTTLYLPWLWGVDYTQPGDVINIVYYGLVSSFTIFGSGMFALGLLLMRKGAF